MMKRNRIITRRDFLRGTVYTAFATSMGLSPPVKREAKAEEKVKVILVRDEKVIDPQGHINPEIVQKMLDQGVSSLMGEENPLQAWKKLIRPTDVVGIKSNVWNPLPTPKELETAIEKRVLEMGVPKESISIDDRGVLNNKVFLSSTALINAHPLRIHHWSGIGGCIKNYIMFVDDPPFYHPDSCADLGAIWNLPIVKGKTRLNVLLVLTPQFYGRGPHNYDPRHIWTYGGMLVSRDPVAVDALGAELLRLKRIELFGEDKPVTPTKHVEYAETRHGIGVADLKRIDLVKLGWQERLML